MRTHPDDKLLEQHCYKSAAGLFNLCVFTCVVDGTHEKVNLSRIIGGLLPPPLPSVHLRIYTEQNYTVFTMKMTFSH